MKVYFKVLGCEKNTVDSEFAAGLLLQKGHRIVKDPLDSDVMIVNTCGFIDDAKRQSIDTIFELAGLKEGGRKLLVTGCLSQRYGKELAKDIPEIDAVLGVNDYMKLPEVLENMGSSADTSAPLLQSGHPDKFEELPERLLEGREQPWTTGCRNCITSRR